MKSLKEKLEARLIPGENDCLEWTGYRNRDGYGQIQVDGKKLLAHRVAWMLHSGEMPSLLVCHTCDNPRCCNVEHLYVGTHTDNMKDKVDRGRWKGGAKSKVGAVMVLCMREMRSQGLSNRQIGKFLGLSREPVRRFLLGICEVRETSTQP